jgi:hypothetical protein
MKTTATRTMKTLKKNNNDDDDDGKVGCLPCRGGELNLFLVMQRLFVTAG